MRIMSNIPALQSYNALTVTNNALGRSIERLSTGLRINSAADDAAGLAISEKMRAQIRGLSQAVMNAQNGISMVQTAEAALGETHSMLQRMRELAVQAANDTLTQEDRSYIQQEIEQLKDEITRIATSTQFNKKKLLDGSAAVLWSASDLSTKAIIKGGLRQIDQFGQKMALEGNFKISITATPGQAEVQKTDIFKIKHKNVIMGLTMNMNAGVTNVRVDNLPSGRYKVVQVESPTTGEIQGWGDFDKQQIFATHSAYGVDGADFDHGLKVAAYNFDDNANDVGNNASVLFEVIAVDSSVETVTFRVQSNLLNVDGNTSSFTEEKFILNQKDGIVGVSADAVITAFGMIMYGGDLKLNGPVNFYKIGDKIVLNYTTAAEADSETSRPGVDAGIAVEADIHDKADWLDGWDTKNISATFGVNAHALKNRDVQFKNFYLNTTNGTVYQGNIVISFDERFKPTGEPEAALTPPGTNLAAFEAAYIGQIAKGDVMLRDIDKFWDSNGRFLLVNPQAITITQGDGTTTRITLYATDTMNDLRSKLNDAIAYGLGQSRYVVESANNFVSFVEGNELKPSGHQSVEGTLIIRSLVPGDAGRITFSGDEDLIRAFSMNIIQHSVENTFYVDIEDAHSATMVAASQKISGNVLVGVIHPNVDVIFDPMANIEAWWNDNTKAFMLRQDSKPPKYETILHLSDNTTIFQVGANEGEDMGLDIGDMSARALGILGIVVSDRSSAARAITTLDLAIARVSSQRAKLGAYQNRLEHTISNLTTAVTNTTAAESRIRDVDMAKEMMEFTKLNILSQAGSAMLAQANQLPQNILALLR